ncbi:MAG: UDP-N-acetylmuramoyl-tripeptide--D-alanyl-D-alanine ligase [Ruminococcaceae bacterium]|nr:UDP-N-acetylmuramoyl-tripeptide--D-alanyl-D-alanine ligase [Oscillospiraceae bacterium]
MTSLTSGQICKIVGGQLYGKSDVRAKTLSTDSRKIGEDALFVALKGEKFDGADYLLSLDNKISMAISHRYEEVSYPLIVVEDTLSALTKLSSYYLKNNTNLSIKVALTGSVGKTTTKEMVYSVLNTTYKTKRTIGNYNNHIGVPITLMSVDEDSEALVCEMGMSHKGEIEHLSSLFESDVAIITNIGHSHIENLGSRENIRDAKLEITKGIKKDGTLIVNGEEELLKDLNFDFNVMRVGLTKGLDIWASDVKMYEDGVEYIANIAEKKIPIKLSSTGEHNVINSLFAIAVGRLYNVSEENIKKGLMNYKSVGFRQDIYFKNNIKVIADCYNAGLESMTASLQMLKKLETKGSRIAVLGDMLELGTFSKEAHTRVGKTVSECKIDILLTLGENAQYIHTVAKKEGVLAYHFDTKDSLATYLKNNLKDFDTVLFKASRSMKFEEIISLAGLEK